MFGPKSLFILLGDVLLSGNSGKKYLKQPEIIFNREKWA